MSDVVVTDDGAACLARINAEAEEFKFRLKSPEAQAVCATVLRRRR